MRVASQVGTHDLTLEEFQLRPDIPIEQLKQKIEYGELKSAEAAYNHSKEGILLRFRERSYVITGQVAFGAAFTCFGLYLSSANYAANVLYLIFLNGVSSLNLRTLQPPNPMYSAALRARHQQQLCPLWAQCLDDDPNPLLCGICRVPVGNAPPRTTPSIFSPEQSFTEGNPFSGDSLRWIIVFVSCVGGVGSVAMCAIMKSVGRSSWPVAAVVWLIAAVTFGATGMACSAVVPPFVDADSTGRVPPSSCGAVDIWPDTPQVDEVSQVCLVLVGAIDIADEVGDQSRNRIACPYLAVLAYLLESLTFLAGNLQEDDPEGWARFELLTYFVYTAAACGVMIVLSLFASDQLEAISDAYAWTRNLARLVSISFGEQFPLHFTDPVTPHNADRFRLWYQQKEFTMVLLLAITGLQLVGIVFACCFGEEHQSKVRVAGLRTVVIVNAVLIAAFYPAFCFLCWLTVDASVNIFLLYSLPTLIQFFFAIRYSVRSDILPLASIVRGRGNLYAVAMTCALLLPFGLIAGMSFCAALVFISGPADGDGSDADSTPPSSPPLVGYAKVGDRGGAEGAFMGLIVVLFLLLGLGVLAASKWIHFCCSNAGEVTRVKASETALKVWGGAKGKAPQATPTDGLADGAPGGVAAAAQAAAQVSASPDDTSPA